MLQLYREMAGMPIQIEVVLDRDDASMLSCNVIQRLVALGCAITVGDHGGKVAAVNGGRISDWDILILASDDMVPVEKNYAKTMALKLIEYFPFYDGAVYFNDGYVGPKLCTLPVIGRRLYEQFGHVYEPCYTSMWCDNEQTALWLAMGRLVYVPYILIKHEHPANTKMRTDVLYQRNSEPWENDQKTFFRREKIVREHGQFAFDSPPLWLTICIATLPERRRPLKLLVDHLYAQMCKHPREVDIIFDSRKGLTTGVKRDALNRSARGHFVVAVDDDDWVSHDYIDRILAAIKANPDADCVELYGNIMIRGESRVFHHALKYSKWSESAGVYRRCPNHLNPVRRELAVKAGYPDKTIGEDADFSFKLYPMLRKEAPMDAAPLYFYFPHSGATK